MAAHLAAYSMSKLSAFLHKKGGCASGLLLCLYLQARVGELTDKHFWKHKTALRHRSRKWHRCSSWQSSSWCLCQNHVTSHVVAFYSQCYMHECACSSRKSVIWLYARPVNYRIHNSIRADAVHAHLHSIIHLAWFKNHTWLK